MKLTLTGNEIYNKSGKLIAILCNGKVFISKNRFSRAIRSLRKLLGNSCYFVIV